MYAFYLSPNHLEWYSDVTVSLKGWKQDVVQPQTGTDRRGDLPPPTRTTELRTDGGVESPEHHESDTEERFNTEDEYWESQGSWFYFERVALCCVVDGRDAPGETDTEENVDRVGSCYITNGGIGSLVVDCGYFTGKGIW